MYIHPAKRLKVGFFPKEPLPKPDFTPCLLEHTNAHKNDSCITFQEHDHKYFVCYENDGLKFVNDNIISVSKLVHQFFIPFDADTVIRKMRASRNWSSTNNCYKGMTDGEIKKLWERNRDESAATGTAFHFVCECYMNGWQGIYDGSYFNRQEVKQFIKFQDVFMKKKKKLIPFRTEFKMFCPKDIALCGTIDLLAISIDHPTPEETGGQLRLTMVDWKNSKKIKRTNNFATGIGPCQNLMDCNLIHYTLQQGLYKYILETYYSEWEYQNQKFTSISIEEMFLCACHENYGNEPEIIELKYLEEVILEIISTRKNSISTNLSNTSP